MLLLYDGHVNGLGNAGRHQAASTARVADGRAAAHTAARPRLPATSPLLVVRVVVLAVHVLPVTLVEARLVVVQVRLVAKLARARTAVRVRGVDARPRTRARRLLADAADAAPKRRHAPDAASLARAAALARPA